MGVQMTDDELVVIAERGFRFMVTPSCTRINFEEYWHTSWDVLAWVDGETVYRESFETLKRAIKHGLTIAVRRRISPIKGKVVPPSWLEVQLSATRLLEFPPVIAAIEAAGMQLIPGVPRDAAEAPHGHDVCEQQREQRQGVSL